MTLEILTSYSRWYDKYLNNRKDDFKETHFL